MVLALIPAVVLMGCYGFVRDETPPEWRGEDAPAAGAGGVAAAGGPGATVFNARCAVCHQMSGEGIPGVYPNLKGSQVATGDPHLPVRIVLHGFQGPIVRNGRSYNGVMQAWKAELTDQEIADVLTFVRSSWGNHAAAIDAALVRDVRDKTKARVAAYTENELKGAI